MHDIASIVIAGALLPAVFAAHGVYFRRGARGSSRQTIVVRDESLGTIPVLSIDGPLSGKRQPPEQVVTMHHEQVVHGDLRLGGRHRHVRAIKITGDLVIEGGAVFDERVIVNGSVHVIGEATFHGGLMAKRDLRVDGHARFGTGTSGSWCFARRVAGKVIYAPINENELNQGLLTA